MFQIFLNRSQTKYLNAILDNLSKKLTKWMIEIIDNNRKVVNNNSALNLRDDVLIRKNLYWIYWYI